MNTRSLAKDAARNRERWSHAGVAMGAISVLFWPLALSQLQRGDVYTVMGPFALAVVIGLTVLGARAGVPLDQAGLAKNAAIGLGCGVAMTALTYVAYAIAAHLIPSLPSHVAALYVASRSEDPAAAGAWTFVILIAEEVLWRGWLLEPLSRRIGHVGALVLSLATYVLAQLLGSGSPVLMLAALVCGALWLTERALTGSMVPSLVSHAIWTPVVIHAAPLTLIHVR